MSREEDLVRDNSEKKNKKYGALIQILVSAYGKCHNLLLANAKLPRKYFAGYGVHIGNKFNVFSILPNATVMNITIITNFLEKEPALLLSVFSPSGFA